MTTPQIAYANLGVAGGTAQSSFVTASLDIRSAFEAHVAVHVYKSQDVSASPEIYAHRSTDGGNTFAGADEGTLLKVFDLIDKAEDEDTKGTIRVDRGYWVFTAMMGGPNTGSIAFTTAEIVSAYA